MRLVPISPTHIFLVDGYFKYLGGSAITRIFYALTFGAFYYAMYSLLACFAYRYWMLIATEGIFGFKISLKLFVQVLIGYGKTKIAEKCFSVPKYLHCGHFQVSSHSQRC